MNVDLCFIDVLVDVSLRFLLLVMFFPNANKKNVYVIWFLVMVGMFQT
jgi:hypothetical protein